MCGYSSTDDEKYMRHAIELAKKGLGWTNPNPMVGAVIVKDGKIIGEGYHKKNGALAIGVVQKLKNMESFTQKHRL